MITPDGTAYKLYETSHYIVMHSVHCIVCTAYPLWSKFCVPLIMAIASWPPVCLCHRSHRYEHFQRKSRFEVVCQKINSKCFFRYGESQDREFHRNSAACLTSDLIQIIKSERLLTVCWIATSKMTKRCTMQVPWECVLWGSHECHKSVTRKSQENVVWHCVADCHLQSVTYRV